MGLDRDPLLPVASASASWRFTLRRSVPEYQKIMFLSFPWLRSACLLRRRFPTCRKVGKNFLVAFRFPALILVPRRIRRRTDYFWRHVLGGPILQTISHRYY